VGRYRDDARLRIARNLRSARRLVRSASHGFPHAYLTTAHRRKTAHV
jgi:hypothetical protein